MRDISSDEAKKVAQILRDECLWSASDRDEEAFVYHVTRDCREYRFCGALGFGGKFRNNGNFDDVPYVDFYPEDRTTEREAMARRANKKLFQLFRRDGARTNENPEKTGA